MAMSLHPTSLSLLPAETFPCALIFPRSHFCSSRFFLLSSGELSICSSRRRRRPWRRRSSAAAARDLTFSPPTHYPISIVRKRGRTVASSQYKQDGEQDAQMQPQIDEATPIAPSTPSMEAAQTPELQCIGTGLDVECVIIPTPPNRTVDRASASPISEVTTPTSSPASIIKDDSIASRSSASTNSVKNLPSNSSEENAFNVECIGTGTDVECVILPTTNGSLSSSNRIASRAASSLKSKGASFDSFIDSTSETTFLVNDGEKQSSWRMSLKGTWEYLVLISPFFFWGTAMVAMKGVLPKAGPLFVAATRLIPSGFLLIGFAAFQNRKQPSGLKAWLAIALFAFVDATCFQHMVLGGIPLLALASFQHDPALSGHIQDLDLVDWLALFYTSIFGSAVSYGVFFYNASQGSLTKLSSLTFLTPMFAALFGYILLHETLNPTQIVGAFVTLASIYLINSKASTNDEDDIV